MNTNCIYTSSEYLKNQFITAFRGLLARENLAEIGRLIADELYGQVKFLQMNKEIKASMWMYQSANRIEDLFKELNYTYNI